MRLDEFGNTIIEKFSKKQISVQITGNNLIPKTENQIIIDFLTQIEINTRK